MILYELHAYLTDHYDRAADQRVKLKDHGLGPRRIEKWIAAFLAENPAGKVVVSVVEKKRWHRTRFAGTVRKLFVQTIAGRSFL